MRIFQEVEATTSSEEVNLADGRLYLSATVDVAFAMPEQDAEFPQRLEEAIDEAGQQIKRKMFADSIERADLELLLEHRDGKDGEGVMRRGKVPYTFKTRFGTVKVDRIRIAHHADGTTEVPSATRWQTPQRVCITRGLKDAVCEQMVDRSTRGSQAELKQDAGDDALVGRTTVLEIAHEEGQAMHAAQEQRAEAVFAQDLEGQQILATAANDLRRGSTPDKDEEGTLSDSEGQPPPTELPVGFGEDPEPPEPLPGGGPRHVDPGHVVVELDEVKVKAQAATGNKEISEYTAIVMTSSQRWHLCAPGPEHLCWQLGALLVGLGVHKRDGPELLALADGARWIRGWFERLELVGKAMVLCWYHLVKRCHQQLSLACRGRAHREQVERQVLAELWEGRVEEAVAVLESRRAEMKSPKANDQLINYLRARARYIPNYRARSATGLWISSNRVEKLNEWIVSDRCKDRGMAWTSFGVHALASVQCAQHNGEWESWRKSRRLPGWCDWLAA